MNSTKACEEPFAVYSSGFGTVGFIASVALDSAAQKCQQAGLLGIAMGDDEIVARTHDVCQCARSQSDIFALLCAS